MKQIFAFAAVALSLSITPVLSQPKPADDDCKTQAGLKKDDPRCPAALLPVGEATNFAFLAPIVGGFFAIGALAGGSTNATTSTASTN